MSTELVYARSPLAERAIYAKSIAAANDMIPRGLFDNRTGQPSPAKILLVMETGAMLGLHPMAALASIDVIEGKAVIAPRAALGLIRGRGHRVVLEESGTVEGGDLKATVTLIRKDDPENPIVASYTPHMAARADLCTYTLNAQTGMWEVRARASKTGKILPWEAYTEDMCMWRAVGRIGRRGAEDILMGIDYFPEELEVLVGEDGTRDENALDEDSIVEEIKALDDLYDLAILWTRLRNDEQLTPRIQAEFDAHAATVTKDSRPPKAGAPGNTGDPAFDAPTEPGAAGTETGHQDDESAPASIPTPEEPKPAEGHTAPPADETEEERYERESAEEFARAQAAEEAARAVTDVDTAAEVVYDAEGTLFDEPTR